MAVTKIPGGKTLEEIISEEFIILTKANENNYFWRKNPIA